MSFLFLIISLKPFNNMNNYICTYIDDFWDPTELYITPPFTKTKQVDFKQQKINKTYVYIYIYTNLPTDAVFSPLCWRCLASAPCRIRKGKRVSCIWIFQIYPKCVQSGHIPIFSLADSLQVNKSIKWNKQIRYLQGRNPLKFKPCWKYRLGQHTRIL